MINKKMSRLTQVEKDKIIKLASKGHSLNQISQLTNRPKSIIHYYSQELLVHKTTTPKFNFSDEELGEFMGIFAGDGGFYFDKKLYKYTIGIYTGFLDSDYKEKQINLFKKIFSKKPQCYTKNNDHVYVIRYYSKDIYNLIKKYLDWNGKKTYSIKLKDMLNNPKEFNIGFLRGLFDTDGSYYRPKKRISYGTVSKELHSQTLSLLRSLGFEPKYHISNPKDKSRFYSVVLHGEQSNKFIKLIKPRNTSKLIR